MLRIRLVKRVGDGGFEILEDIGIFNSENWERGVVKMIALNRELPEEERTYVTPMGVYHIHQLSVFSEGEDQKI